MASISKADESDDLVEKLARKQGFITEREGLEKNKPLWKFGITDTLSKKNAEDVQTILKELPKLKGLKMLFFSNSRMKDAILKAAGECKKLEYLDLGLTLITDEGLKELAGLNNLKTLGLDGTRITDESLKYIAQIKNLESLKITRTRITGSGFEELAVMKKLKSIDAVESPLTDECLKHLVAIKPLETFIPGGKITQEAVDELKRKRPKLAVAGYSNNPKPKK